MGKVYPPYMHFTSSRHIVNTLKKAHLPKFHEEVMIYWPAINRWCPFPITRLLHRLADKKGVVIQFFLADFPVIREICLRSLDFLLRVNRVGQSYYCAKEIMTYDLDLYG